MESKNVQLPSLCNLPYGLIKQILRRAYLNEKSAALRYRLVNKSFNDVILSNIRLHLYYNANEPHGFQLNRFNIIPTNSLINSSLISRIFTLHLVANREGNWDQQDLISLASHLCRTVDVNLFLSYFPLLLFEQLPPQMRVVSVDVSYYPAKLTQTEVNLIANLQDLNRLSIDQKHLPQLDDQRVGQLHIHELQIDWLFSNVSKLQGSFSDNFRHLRTLSITDIEFMDADGFTFRGVRLPHLIRCDIGLRYVMSILSMTDNTERLLTSMRLVMPKLKELNCNFFFWLKDLDQMGLITSQFIRMCPATVEEFGLKFKLNLSRCKDPVAQWKLQFSNLFTQVLDSNFTRVSIHVGFETIWYASCTMPFQFEKSDSGEQIGQSQKTTVINWLSDRYVPADRYLLKKKNGQICKLYLSTSSYNGFCNLSFPH